MSSTSLSGGWSGLQQLIAYNSEGTVLSKYEQGAANTTDGPRHGTVITLRDPRAIRIAMKVRNTHSWSYSMPEDTGFNDVYADTVATPHDADIAWLADKRIFMGYGDGSGLMRRLSVRIWPLFCIGWTVCSLPERTVISHGVTGEDESLPVPSARELMVGWAKSEDF